MSIIKSIFAGSNSPELTDTRNPRMWLVNSVGGSRTTAGENVSHESAMTLSAYFGALRVVSEDCAKIPLFVYRDRADGGKDKAREHPAYQLLHRSPNHEMTPITFKTLLVSWAQGWGGGFAVIERDGAGSPLALWPVHPSRVRVGRDDQQRLVYYVKTTDNGKAEHAVYQSRDMIHIFGLGPNGVGGWSVLQMAAESLGLGMALQRFGASFFGNGTTAAGVLQHPGTLTNDALTHMRDSWAEQHAGADNAHKPMILEEGMEWIPISVPPEQAQFLVSREFQVVEICRWFRLAPHKLQHLNNATFSNIEDQSLNHMGDTLDPWLIRMEEEFVRKLFRQDEQDHFARFNRNATMRADHEKRSLFYDRMWKIGSLNQNEIRALEDMNPIEGGDTYYIPINNMAPASAAQAGGGREVNESRPRGLDNQTSGIGSKASARLFAAAADRCVVREMKKVRHDSGKHRDSAAFASSLESFAAGHVEIFAANLLPVAESSFEFMANRPIGNDARNLADCVIGFAQLHARSLVDGAVDAHKVGAIDGFCDRWSSDRPVEISDSMCGMIAAMIKGADDVVSCK